MKRIAADAMMAQGIDGGMASIVGRECAHFHWPQTLRDCLLQCGPLSMENRLFLCQEMQHAAVPERHQAFVREIAALYGVKLAATE